jgi:SAM-dependent methyltransferase
MKTLLRRLLPHPDATRHAWVRARLAALPKGHSLLDIGAGPQRYRADCAHLKYRSQDFAQYQSGGDGDGLQGGDGGDWFYGKLDYTGDAWSIPARAGSFDAVLCTEVLEHVARPRDTVLEMARLLRPGGVAIVTAPTDSIPHMTPYYYSHGLAREFYAEAARAAGLKLARFETYSGAVDFLLQESYRLLRHGPWLLKPLMLPPVLGLMLARLAGFRGAEYPCFGALVVLRRPAKGRR